MKPDADQNRQILDAHDIPDAMMEQALEALWDIMEAFADLAWNEDSTHLALAAARHEGLLDCSRPVAPKSKMRNDFNNKAHGEIARKNKGQLV